MLFKVLEFHPSSLPIAPLSCHKNNLNISVLLSGIPRLRQIVTQCTYKNKILDVILTNLHSAYSVPEIVPPVPADDPCHGAPSDHYTPVAYPR